MADGRSSTRAKIETVLEIDLGCRLGQLRANVISLDRDGRRGILAAYCADHDVDPYYEMFFFPTGTLKLALFDLTGKMLWRRDLGPAVVPGQHFCPVSAFDLDGDGVDEIWYVNNADVQHPLSIRGRRLQRLDGLTGEATGDWDWPRYGGDQSLSHAFRNFIVGGRAGGEPVLVTAQGTYQDMHIQGWRPDIRPRWRVDIAKDAPGARGSHMSPIVDLNNDGIDELLWGERCIELDGGKELFCADRDVYCGHSDVIQPVLDRQLGRWFIYTCRESDPKSSPRVALFDDAGRRVWGDVAEGHMDMGWVARLGDGMRHVAMAVRIGGKSAGPQGLFHQGTEEFLYDALTGEPMKLPFKVYRTMPVDIDGDGYHELVRSTDQGGQVLDRHGEVLGRIEGRVAMAWKLCDLPGEQLLTFRPDGKMQVWADRNAADSDAARQRYANAFYRPSEPVAGL